MIITDPQDPNMNAYVDKTYVADYAELHGLADAWCNYVSRQEAAIINASRYVDLTYASRAPGRLYNADQAMLFPRTTYKDCMGRIHEGGVIPEGLKRAVAQLAIDSIADGTINYSANEANNIKSKSVSVGQGAVSETVHYWVPQQAATYTVFSKLMASFLPCHAGSANVGYRTR